MHGQWDWMNDPQINSSTWDWDSASTARGVEALAQLRPPHVHEHPRQGPRPRLRDHADRPAPEVAPGLPRAAVLQPRAGGLLRVGRRAARPRLRRDPQGARSPSARCSASSRGWPARRAARSSRTTSLFPAARSRAASGFKTHADRPNFTANIVRNVWAYAIIFCGHFPDQTYTFSEEEVEDETRGALVRAPAARRGEHRGQPAVPRHERQPRLPGRAPPVPRHAEHALRRDRAAVREICERYELPYNTGPFLSSSSARCSARSCGWRSRAASRGPSPAPTAATGRRSPQPTRRRSWRPRLDAPARLTRIPCGETIAASVPYERSADGPQDGGLPSLAERVELLAGDHRRGGRGDPRGGGAFGVGARA